MAWHETSRLKYHRSSGRYTSDTSDDEWQLLEPFMPPEKRLGRRRTTKLRSVMDALLYMVETGCPSAACWPRLLRRSDRWPPGHQWAHLRRDFHDIWKSTNAPIARDALEQIGKLYDVERAINSQPIERRHAARQRESRPLVLAFRTWCEQQQGRIPGKGDLAKAMRYALGRWPSFTLFLDDARVAIDNNAAERAIRPISIGRKNSYDRCQDVEVKGTVPLLAATSFAVDGRPVELRTSSCFDGRSNSYSGIGYPMMTVRRKAASIWLRASDGAGPNFCSRIPSTALDALSTAGCR